MHRATARRACGAGPSMLGRGRTTGVMCSCTSTTTPRDTRCEMRWRSRSSSGFDRVRRRPPHRPSVHAHAYGVIAAPGSGRHGHGDGRQDRAMPRCRPGTSLAAITVEASSIEDTNMHAKAKIFGHPIHQMLIVFPLGLLATSVIFDIAYHASGNGRWADIAYVMIACGIIGG